MHHISIDVETFSSVPIGKAGLYKYVQSPDFEILLFGYSLDSAPPVVLDFTQNTWIPKNIWMALRNQDVIKHAYNAAFEWYCLSRWMSLTPKQSRDWLSQWRDTMLHALYCGYPASLDAAGKALGLPEDKRKLATGKALIKLFCTPHTPTDHDPRTRIRPADEPEKWKLFKTYNAGDVTAEQEIERRLSPFPVPDDIQHQWETDLRINSRGVALDLDLIHGALDCDDTVSRPLVAEAKRLTGLDNPNSMAQVKGWLQGRGYEVSTLRKDDVTALLDGNGLDPTARRVLEIRQDLGKTSTKKYNAMQAAACKDGRVRGTLQFYGANRSGRWAGRLVQTQNLPRTNLHGKMLDLARELVKARKVETLKLIYGSVPDTLSQLIRTALIPAPGNLFVDADFSAIEARVVAWLAGEEWVLDVFRHDGKIYEATAANMFGVPKEKIVKGQPEYALRQKGKIATLALGYGGGAGALINMGALKQGLTEEELPDIVRRWREANKRIRDLWYKVEGAALKCVQTGRPQGVRGLLIAMEGDQKTGQWFMTITLPSGRKLYYAKPFITPGQYGDALHYWGMNQTSHKWQTIDTWGGKLVENCLSEKTQVLTDHGWKELTKIQEADKLWDGMDWVSHGGLICKGIQKTICLSGIYLTQEHLVLTTKGWKHAQECEGYYPKTYARTCSKYSRDDKWPFNCYSILRFRRPSIILGRTLHLRQRFSDAGFRVSKRKTKIMRMRPLYRSIRRANHTWFIQTPALSCLALNETTLYSSNLSCMAGIRGPWYSSLRQMAKQLRGLLDRYEPNIPTGPFDRPNRRKRKLLPGKLPLGKLQNASEEQAGQHLYRYPLGTNHSFRCFGKIGNWRNNITVSDQQRMPQKPFIRSPGCYEQVYDIKNAGPNHQFTVWSNAGPVIVHNCVQAIARDCLAENIERLETAGYPIVTHIHDEVVIDRPKEKADLDAVCQIMSQPIPWAPGLPLGADGWVGNFYTKD